MSASRIQRCSHPCISSWGSPRWRLPWSWTGEPCRPPRSAWHSDSASGTSPETHRKENRLNFTENTWINKEFLTLLWYWYKNRQFFFFYISSKILRKLLIVPYSEVPTFLKRGTQFKHQYEHHFKTSSTVVANTGFWGRFPGNVV